ncbi:MAG: FUSC family protein [Actinomycetota bacterium]
MASGERAPDDGREILPDFRVTDVLQQRPEPFRSPWQVARIAVAVTASWAVGYWLSPSSFGIFAPLTTLMVVATSPWSTWGLSIQRVVSSGVGVFLATLWVTWVGVTWWSVLIAMVAALVLASRLPLSLGGQFQIPTSVLFVFALGQVTWEQAAWRVLDVAIGGAVGILAIYLPPPKPRPDKFEASLQSYRDHIMDLLEAMAREIREQAEPLGPDVLHRFIQDSRSLRGDADTARQSLVALAESIAFNPRGRGYQPLLAEDALRLRRLASIGVHVRGIAGVINKDYDRQWISPALQESTLAGLLEELASLGRLALGSPGMPVRPEAPQELSVRARAFDTRVRGLADQIVHTSTGEVLESVSLLGRLEYVADQMEGFDRVPGEGDDRFEDD